MDQLAKQAAQLALRLAALPADGRPDAKMLEDVEALARAILQSAAAVRLAQNTRTPGESRGIWRAMQPFPRQ